MHPIPRKSLEPGAALDYLSILDENGEVDDDLDPSLDLDLLRRMHATMVKARRFDELLLEWQRGGRIGTFAPVSGQEAGQIGAMSVVRHTDWFVPAFRENAAALWRGWDPVQITVFNAGYNEGATIPDDARDFPIAVPVASQIPHAVGLAYSITFDAETDAVGIGDAGGDGDGLDLVITFFGDGATSEGDFHEALNFAGRYRVPVIFICQNNQWAISTPRDEQTAAETLAQKGLAYGIPGIQVDGNDILAVHVAVDEAARRARSGGGPTLVECLTYRLSLHTTADDPSLYRDEAEVERWKERDPILRFRRYLLAREAVDEDGLEALEEEARRELDGVWDQARARMEELGGPEVMFDHVYERPTAEMEAQREAMTHD